MKGRLVQITVLIWSSPYLFDLSRIFYYMFIISQEYLITFRRILNDFNNLKSKLQKIKCLISNFRPGKYFVDICWENVKTSLVWSLRFDPHFGLWPPNFIPENFAFERKMCFATRHQHALLLACMSFLLYSSRMLLNMAILGKLSCAF